MEMVKKVSEMALFFVKRFIMGWYMVERKIDVLSEELKEIKKEIEAVLAKTCHDCPVRYTEGHQDRRKSS